MPRANVIAHRGASRERPENTLAAFSRALELGADGIELDVHRTADGRVVVHHDPVPHPGHHRGELAWKPIATMTLAQLHQLRDGSEHRIPTLEEVLELVGARLTIYCELKGTGVVDLAAPLLRNHHGSSAIHSFDHRAVRRAAILAPEVPRGILLSCRLVETAYALRAAEATTLWAHREFVDEEVVDELHAAGGSVIVWTANDPLEIARLCAIGIDGICTDDVARAQSVVASTIPPPGA